VRTGAVQLLIGHLPAFLRPSFAHCGSGGGAAATMCNQVLRQ